MGQSAAERSTTFKYRRLLRIRSRRCAFVAGLIALVLIVFGATRRLLSSSLDYTSTGLPADFVDAKEHSEWQAAREMLTAGRENETYIEDETPVARAAPPPPVKKSIIEVEESASCKVPRPVPPCLLKKRERIHVVFVSAMWYREPFTQEETSSIIKSIIFQTQCKLWIHFLVAGAPETDIIPKMMEAMGAYIMIPSPSPSPATPTNPSPPTHPHPPRGYLNKTTPGDPAVLYSLHPIPTEWVVQQAKGLDLYPLAHHAGIPGMCKFFMADILWQVRRAVYLDVDMILAGDIQELWQYFNVFNKDHALLYYMGNNHPEGHNRRRLLRPYCSCQLVMELDRMRAANTTKMILSALDGRKIKSLKEYVEDGDQFLFMWLCKQYKKVCRILPRMWNVSGCTKPIPFLGLTARGKQANETCWKIVHFNCLGHVRGRQGEYRIPGEWSEATRWAKGMKYDQLHPKKDWRMWKHIDSVSNRSATPSAEATSS